MPHDNSHEARHVLAVRRQHGIGSDENNIKGRCLLSGHVISVLSYASSTMKSIASSLILLAVGVAVLAHEHDDDLQMPLDYVRFPYQAAYPGDNEGTTCSTCARKAGELTASSLVTANSVFSGITTFAKLPWVQCLGKDKDTLFDVAFIGAPFDTGTSYRPGARFGPAGIRAGSRRLTLYGGYNVPLEVNPFLAGLKLVDCGDIPVTPYDNKYAIQQIEDGHKALLHRTPFSPLGNDSVTGKPLVPVSADGKHHPRVITLGGDHTIVLPLLRSIYTAYGAISVIHFDSHLDTWKPQHGAIRTTLSGPADYENDDASGFQRIEAREIDTIGTDGIIKKIKETVGDKPVYLSIDIDSIDPAFAPATGTPETGGWSTRELRTILRGLDGLHIVSADIVEVAPAYDTNAELTTMAAADVLYEVLSVMSKTPLGFSGVLTRGLRKSRDKQLAIAVAAEFERFGPLLELSFVFDLDDSCTVSSSEVQIRETHACCIAGIQPSFDATWHSETYLAGQRASYHPYSLQGLPVLPVQTLDLHGPPAGHREHFTPCDTASVQIGRKGSLDSTPYCVVQGRGSHFGTLKDSALAHPSYSEWAADSAIRRGQGNGLDSNENPIVSYDHGELQWALRLLYERTGNSTYYDYIKTGVDNVLLPNGTVGGGYSATQFQLDPLRVGPSFLYLYEKTGEQKYKVAANEFHDQLIYIHKRTAEGQFWHKLIYPNQGWLDGIYMGDVFYATFTQVFQPGNTSAWDDITLQFRLMFDHTLQTEQSLVGNESYSGLLYHGYDYSHVAIWASPDRGHSPEIWDRALGWAPAPP
ncbi:hypothetical protein NM688_g8216 [Phlebia brevispora]|uniref:Uncharacterized protein n=1 Tax=Phlebia brevispora TaxID=194682 RepID=A0ACC1RVT2_9APHY|nr:hypothetical protein NM688_g8216 [Phlebia brevispora]